MKFDIRIVFENLPRILKYYKNLANVTEYLHGDLCTFMTISLSVLLRMRNVSDKIVEKIKTHVVFIKL